MGLQGNMDNSWQEDCQSYSTDASSQNEKGGCIEGSSDHLVPRPESELTHGKFRI